MLIFSADQNSLTKNTKFCHNSIAMIALCLALGNEITEQLDILVN